MMPVRPNEHPGEALRKQGRKYKPSTETRGSIQLNLNRLFNRVVISSVVGHPVVLKTLMKILLKSLLRFN